MHPHLQLQGVLFAGKRVREGVHVAVGERQILGRDIRSTELHQRHYIEVAFVGETWKKTQRETSVSEAGAVKRRHENYCFAALLSVAVCALETKQRQTHSSSFTAS